MSELSAAHAHNALQAAALMYGAALKDQQNEIEQLTKLVQARDQLLEMQGQQLNEMRERIKAGKAENERLVQEMHALESRLSNPLSHPDLEELKLHTSSSVSP